MPSLPNKSIKVAFIKPNNAAASTMALRPISKLVKAIRLVSAAISTILLEVRFKLVKDVKLSIPVMSVIPRLLQVNVVISSTVVQLLLLAVLVTQLAKLESVKLSEEIRVGIQLAGLVTTPDPRLATKESKSRTWRAYD